MSGPARTSRPRAADVPVSPAVNSNTTVQTVLADHETRIGTGGASDASTTVKGVTKMSVAPASAGSPIAVGDNDKRIQPQITGTAAGNLGTAQTITFTGAEKQWLIGVLNGNLAVTVVNPIAGSRLKVIALQDGTGSRTLTIAGMAVTISSTPSTGLAMVTVDWVDATNFRVESAGVFTESDPNAVLKSLGTTKGDIIAFTASGTPARLAAGSDGQVLKAASGQSTGLQWAADTGFANPMTTSGDIIYGGASGAPTRLAKGSDTQVLTLASGTPTWAAASGGGGAAGIHPAAVYGLKTWNFDPWIIDEATLQNGGVLITGTIVVPYDTSVTGIAAVIKTVGAGLTVAYGALWNIAGTTRVAKTASQTTNWAGTTGYKKAAFTGGPISLTAGTYIFGLLTNGTTATEWRAKIANDASFANMDTADPAYRAAYMFPADDTTATLTGLTATVKQPWVGLY